MGTAKEVLGALRKLAKKEARPSVERIFRDDAASNVALGVAMGSVFAVAKANASLSLEEIEKLLEEKIYEARVAAVAVMDVQARQKKRSDVDKEALYALYLRRHDRINNWALVDRAAVHVVGVYLWRQKRPKERLKILMALAASKSPYERRTAIVATHAFIKEGDIAPTFAIAEKLVHDEDKFVQMAVASWTREAGKRDEDALFAFLKEYKEVLPKSTVTNAAKVLSNARRDALKK